MSEQHLKHMVETRPDGLDKDAAKWALERIKELEAELDKHDSTWRMFIDEEAI